MSPDLNAPIRLSPIVLLMLVVATWNQAAEKPAPGDRDARVVLSAQGTAEPKSDTTPEAMPGAPAKPGSLAEPLGDSAPAALGAMVVTANRTPQPLENVAATTQVLTGTALRTMPTMTVDDTLRAVPSFSLFRRNDSLTANPTTQGVSLRGLGPSGASRSLVLLDGVPLNDPFGGWIAWSKIPRDAVTRAEIVPGGGATAWGDAALAGVVQLFTTPLIPARSVAGPGSTAGQPDAPATARLSAMAGNYSSRSSDFVIAQPVAQGTLELLGEDFRTDGFRLVAPERRGPIDVPAWSRHESYTMRWSEALGNNLAVTATARLFDERRNNGTPDQNNASREKFASATVAGQPAAVFAWTATEYAQEETFASTFSSVNASRTTETPASDQYAVPATALGASWTGTWSHSNGGRTSGGADFRAVHGETREYYSYAAGEFTHERVAGGAQSFAGLFALHEQPITQTLRLTTGARFDRWAESDGHRRERDRQTGAVTRDDAYPDHHGDEFSPSLGTVWSPLPHWRVHANAQRSFRVPTLNELYRPFRQGANITEANPALTPEHATSAEAGAEWRWGPQSAGRPGGEGLSSPSAKPEPLLTLGATVFWNDLRDAVSNVTLARGPGTFPLFGVLPVGGIGRERLNLGHIVVQGTELSAQFRIGTALSFTGTYLYDEATVKRGTAAIPTGFSALTSLTGNQLAEVPRHSAALTAIWAAPARFTLAPRLRWIGRQFDDDENTLRLNEAVVLDVGISRPFARHWDAILNVENIGNARVETARSADGIVNIGTPRFVFGGIRAKW